MPADWWKATLMYYRRRRKTSGSQSLTIITVTAMSNQVGTASLTNHGRNRWWRAEIVGMVGVLAEKISEGTIWRWWYGWQSYVGLSNPLSWYCWTEGHSWKARSDPLNFTVTSTRIQEYRCKGIRNTEGWGIISKTETSTVIWTRKITTSILPGVDARQTIIHAQQPSWTTQDMGWKDYQ